MARRLLPHEWERLRSVFESQGAQLPEFSGLPCLVQEDDTGAIIGVILLHPVPQLELWVAEDARGKGVARELAEAMKPLAEDEAPYFALVRNARLAGMCEEFGLEVVGQAWLMERGK